MRWLVLTAAIVVAMALAVVLLAEPFSGGDGPAGSVADVEEPVLPPAELERLASRYAPLVWIHRGEDFGPSDPAEFLERSSLYWRRLFRDRRLATAGAVDPDRLGRGCVELEEGCYREDEFLAIHLTRPHHKSPDRAPGLSLDRGFYLDPPDAARAGEVGEDPDAPIFYEARRTASGGIRLTYWFFFGFSRPFKPFLGGNLASFFSHEGDWENVDVVLRPDQSPSGVFFFGHGHPRLTVWEDVCKLVDGREDCSSSAPGRPIVFSARLSHASYPSAEEGRGPASRVCARLFGREICSYDLRSRGFRWDPLDDPDGLLDVRAEPWYGFGGAWGKAGRLADTTGPLGPSRFKLSHEPEPGELTQQP